MKTAHTCPKCNGTGQEIYHICDGCGNRSIFDITDESAELCQDCWAKTFIAKEIQNL